MSASLNSLPLGQVAGASPKGVIASVMSLFAVARQRRALARLDDAQLADIGVSRADAEAEAKRAFWDTPRR